MSIKTTVTLDDDVLACVQDESRLRGESFRRTLNELLRSALVSSGSYTPRRTLRIEPSRMGLRSGLNFNDIEALVEYSEGEQHR